jgi:hypothetical protein
MVRSYSGLAGTRAEDRACILALPLGTGFLRGRDLGEMGFCCDALLPACRSLFRFTLNSPLKRTVQYLPMSALRALTSLRIHLFRFQPLDSFRKVICDPQIKGGRFELDLVPHEFSPFVPGGVDPAHEVEVVDVFQRAEVCALSHADEMV